MDSKDKKIDKNKTFLSSFEFAWHGFKTAFQEEKNMRVHTCAAILAITAGVIFRLTLNEWRWLLLAIFLVVLVEIINTTFENVVDMVTDFHFHIIAKKIKDMAAAAVLLTAVFAIVIGITIFGPKLWALLSTLFN
ncbi:diacylglycerol kinase family protein [Enterococcus timonensis]|uniref:diacylglycerol kinase family protein n=1 Tax=Enterococcus timonensis TaxID=1852364 RepID=UPI0008DA37D9|nr:diacylglycerol kinase family protein [Enterococcus timonensis]